MNTGELLAKLRELDAAASPGLWSPWPHDPSVVLDGDLWAILKAQKPKTIGRANARLAALAHEVLPLVEALYKIRWETAEPGSPSCEIAEQGLARLAERMEAL